LTLNRAYLYANLALMGELLPVPGFVRSIARNWIIFRFALVSVISASISFVLLALIYGYLRLWSEVPSTLVANVIAGVPGYFLIRQWVWSKTGRSHLWREVVPFWVVSLTSILLATRMAWLARSVAQSHDLNHLQRTILLITANLSAFGFLWILKFLFFGRLFSDPSTKGTNRAT
jgi:putative flippase GtrA